MTTPDVVVVGGGIVGTATAALLAEAGARVLLVEREGLASGASGANSGVVQHPFDPVLAQLYRRSVDLYRELAARSSLFRIAGRPAGLLYISASEERVRHQAALIEGPFPALVPEILAGEDLRRVEPQAGPDLWACRVDIGYPVVPSSSTYAYATVAESLGVVVRIGRSASLDVAGDRATGVRIDGEVVAAGAVVAAAGPWTPALLDPAGRWAPIRPRWGVVVEAELGMPPRHVFEEAGIEAEIDVAAGHGGAAWAPAGDGGDTGAAGAAGAVGAAGAGAAGALAAQAGAVEFSLVPTPGTAASVGSTFLLAEPDPATWIEPILERAARFVPAVLDAPIRGVRACARPQSDDGRPLIGRVPGLRDLYVCAGHGPWGISTGPGSARLIADLVLGRLPEIPVELDPARFGDSAA
jgi:glycine/D-amino acid oxidase-like deaminating enzyme